MLVEGVIKLILLEFGFPFEFSLELLVMFSIINDLAPSLNILHHPYLTYASQFLLSYLQWVHYLCGINVICVAEITVFIELGCIFTVGYWNEIVGWSLQLRLSCCKNLLVLKILEKGLISLISQFLNIGF